MKSISLSGDQFFKDFYYFQREAVEASIKHLVEEKKRNGVIVQPTGSGKTYTLAGQVKVFAGDYQGRVLMVSHTKNIVDQDHKTAKKLWKEGSHLFGVNSAGLGRRDFNKQVLFTGIQSVYKDAKKIGKVNFLIPDECHAINMVDSVMYKQFIEDLYDINPDMRVGGLTAHDFRMTMGKIWGPSKDLLFDDLIYKANVKELIAQKYISKPINPPIKDEKALIDTTGVEIIKTKNDTEYNQQQLDERVNIPDKIKRQTKIVLDGSLPHESIASFAHNIKHCELIAQSYIDQGEKSIAVVHSEIKGDEKKLIEDFKSGKIRVLVSVNMFVEGFDAPNIQVIDDRKPTASPGRYGQMGGRGFRVCKEIGKYSFKYFCFSGNVGLHGPLDQIESYASEDTDEPPFKRCKGHGCKMMVHARMKICPHCGYIFPVKEIDPKDRTLDTLDLNSLISEPKWFTVKRMMCQPSKNKNAISAQYICEGLKPRADIEYNDDGITWLKNHLGNDIPFDITNFFNGGYRSKLTPPKRIFVDEAGLASKILKYEF
jgi:DNA repair protein RadD